MKEVTEWDNNPREMWVWDFCPKDAIKRKVVYIRSGSETRMFNVIAIGEKDETPNTRVFEHCAEIEPKRRMTNKELARWLREKPDRECHGECGYATSYHSYKMGREDEEVDNDIYVREGDSPWFVPFAEEEFDEKQGGKNGE